MTDDRFDDLDFERFKLLARDESLAPYERVGFPGAFRKGRETTIFEDIRFKLTNLDLEGKIVLDIGAGCSDLALLTLDHCEARGHRLILIDSEEMLQRLPAHRLLTKIPAYFPRDCQNFLSEFGGRVDAILTYSVIQYVFAEANVFAFLDSAASLLAPGGQLLVGDIPNSSMRKRFLSSEAGARYHREYMETETAPDVRFNTLEQNAIDDGVVTAILLRYRAAGFHTFILPQRPDLPMSNRREDLMLCRP